MTTEQKVIEIVAAIAGTKADRIKPETKLVADLGLDSLDIIEVVMGVEDEFGIEIADEVAEKLASVQDVIDAAKGGA